MRRYTVRFSHPKAISSPPDKICTEERLSLIRSEIPNEWITLGLFIEYRRNINNNIDLVIFSQHHLDMLFVDLKAQ